MTSRNRKGHLQRSPLPKPYNFVPLPTDKPQRRPPAGHHRYQPDTLNGTLQAVIVARSPVHVASGILEQVPVRIPWSRDTSAPAMFQPFRPPRLKAVFAAS